MHAKEIQYVEKVCSIEEFKALKRLLLVSLLILSALILVAAFFASDSMDNLFEFGFVRSEIMTMLLIIDKKKMIWRQENLADF